MRKKINKADEFYITNKYETMSAEEIANEIELDIMVVKKFIKEKTGGVSRITKGARVRVGGQVIGAQLTQSLADSPNIQRKDLKESDKKHIYKSPKRS